MLSVVRLAEAKVVMAPHVTRGMENVERRTVLRSPISGEGDSNESSTSNEARYIPMQVCLPSYIPNTQERFINYKVLPVNEFPQVWASVIDPLKAKTDDDNISNIISPHSKKKKPQPFPDECKDTLYWERRRRNNESAKKSRALRKIKEQQTSMRVLQLEQENLKLKTEVSYLKEELETLKKIHYTKTTTDS